MHVRIKNLPKLHLADLLRRRKMTLKQFINESGIMAYGALLERCSAMGIQAPTEEEYLKIVPIQVSCQQDGVVVIEPPSTTITEVEEIIMKEELIDDDLTIFQASMNQSVRDNKRKKKTTS
jgi:hypothetical protein